MYNDYSFKNKCNSLQFKFKSWLQDDIEDIHNDQYLHESIKITHRSPPGWATIAEYKDDPFASDSENSKKIWLAENTALPKSKSSFTSARNPDCTSRLQFPNDSLQHGFNPPPLPFFFSSSYQSNQKIQHLPKAKKKFTNQQILFPVTGKQNTDAVDASLWWIKKFSTLTNLTFRSMAVLKGISPTGKIL